jgi:hypothetical protein
VAVQDDADGEFAREVEAAVQKRGEDIIRPVGRERRCRCDYSDAGSEE